MAGVAELVRGLVALAAGGGEVVIERSVWGGVVEPRPQRSGEFRYEFPGGFLRVVRVGGVYGYLEAGFGDCRVSGVLVYGQARIVFRPSSVEGGCGGASRAPGLSRG